MDEKLIFKAIIKFISGVVLTGALVFWPAGTFKFVNGWLFMGVFRIFYRWPGLRETIIFMLHMMFFLSIMCMGQYTPI